jgi:hypothetical protein
MTAKKIMTAPRPTDAAQPFWGALLTRPQPFWTDTGRYHQARRDVRNLDKKGCGIGRADCGIGLIDCSTASAQPTGSNAGQLALTTGSSPASTAAGTTVTPAPASSNSSAKLAGAIVGPICAVILILGLAYMFYRRKQNVGAMAITAPVAHSKQDGPEPRPRPVELPPECAELPGDLSYREDEPGELRG